MKLNRQINVIILISMSLFLAISIGLSVYSLNSLKNTELSKMRETLMSERENNLRDVVQNAYSVLETANFYEPAQKAIANMRFGENKQNFFYIVDMSGMFWVNPANPQLIGTDGSGLKGAKGSPYIQKIMTDALVLGEGFIEYYDVKSGSGKPSKKLVHFKRFKDWEWVLCADMFVDDIDTILLTNQAEIEKAMMNQIKLLAALGVLALLLAASISTLFFRSKLVMPISKITDALDKIAEGDFDVRMNIRSSEEINKLVDAVERMQNSFAVAYRRLKANTHRLEVLESEKKEVDEVFESKGVTKIKLKSAV